MSSTFEAETLSLTEAMDRSLLVKDQFMKLTGLPKNLIKIEILTDCNDTVESVYSTKQNPKGGRILVEIAKVKEAMERGEVESVKWIPTQDMLADVLTKRGVRKET